MTDEKHKIHVGQKLTAVIEDLSTNRILASWDYEILKINDENDLEKGLETRLINEHWESQEAKKIHSIGESITNRELQGSGDTALEVTKFAWDFIKDNKAVSNAKDTTTSIILKGTDPNATKLSPFSTVSAPMQSHLHFMSWGG